MRTSGTLLCLGSGAAFGAMAGFGKLAYGAGGALVLAAAALVERAPRPAVRMAA